MNIKTFLQNNKAYEIKEEEINKFEGTFDELIKLDNEGYIKPIFKDNQLIGLRYEDEAWQGNKLKEAQDQYAFTDAYIFKPVAKWLTILYEIKDLKNTLDKYYLNNEDSKVIQDLFNNIIEDLNNSNKKDYNEDYNTNTPINELKVNYLFKASETIKNYNELSNKELLRAIKRYLNIRYGYCLAKNNNIKVSIIKDEQGVDYIEVENVEWGRKLRPSELATREAKYYN